MIELLDCLIRGGILIAVVMSSGWLLARKLNCYSIVTILWGLSFLVLTLLYSLSGGAGQQIQNIGLSMVALWSLRLSAYLGWRLRRHFPDEDPRYAKLKAEWGEAAPKRFRNIFSGRVPWSWSSRCLSLSR